MYWTESLGRIELNITKKDAMSCSHSGQCLPDVLALMEKPYIKRQLNKLDENIVKESLSEYGAWTEEDLSNHEDNLERLLWIACCDIEEER